jgi:hypothetical protein
MSDFKVIDTILAYQLENGDLFEVEGHIYRVSLIRDDGDSIQISVECQDDALDDDEIILDPDDDVRLLDYNYDGVEV